MNSIQKYGLIGSPIRHSLSPALFRAGFNGLYEYDLIETSDFEEAFHIFLDRYDGVNVTSPFKELAIQKADILSDECKTVGATNLLVKTPEGIKAYNSDFLGVRSWLSGVSQSVRVLIVGAGGAGKAAAAAADSLGMETVRMNRTQYSIDFKPLSKFREEFRKADIIIYCLPVRIEELDALSTEDFCPGKPKVIMEANYRNPSFDENLICRMQEANAMISYTDGRAWLLHQAIEGYGILTGESPDKNRMEAVINSK